MVVIKYSSDGDSYTTITDKVISIKWNREKELAHNRFEIVFNPNILGDTIAEVRPGQFIQILDGATVKYTGLMTALDYSKGSRESFKATGTDSSMDLFGGQVPVTKESKLASVIVTELVTEFAGDAKNKVTAVAAGSGGHVQLTTVTIDYFASSPIRLYDVLMNLCMPVNTDGSTQYTFYVDADNELHYEPLAESSSSIVETDCISYGISYSLTSKFNTAYIDCGTDYNGSPLWETFTDGYSYNLMGDRIVMKYFNEEQIATKLKEEYTEGVGAGQLTNAELIVEAKRQGLIKAKQYVYFFGKVRKNLVIILPGTFSYSLGTEISFDTPQTKDDRWDLKSIEHEYGKKGWTTRLKLEVKL